MMRLNLVLLVAVLASAMVLVRTQYESRRLTDQNEKAALEARRLNTERERLSVEQRAQSVPLRVERLAKEQLAMRATTPAITQYVRTVASSAASSPASGATATSKP
jgi:cell division protein FtsL